jgi:hypothetical protein
MRKIITAIALTTVMAAPVFARTPTTHHNVAPSETIERAPAPVFLGSEYIGQDPDPFIEQQFRREQPSTR